MAPRDSCYAIPATVRFVLFDAVGTTLWPEPGVTAAYAAAARRHGAVVDEATLATRFRAAFALQESLDRRDWRTSEMRERERWQTIVAEVLPECGPQAAAVFESLWEHFALAAHWRIYDDVAECWARLLAAGYRIGIASNFDQRLPAICRVLSPLRQAEWIITSAGAGWRKPAAQFFQHACSQMNCAPHEILLVGDDLENDFHGARAAGCHAVLLNRGERTTGAPGDAIQSLARLEPG